MGSGPPDYLLGVDFQRGHGLVVSLGIALNAGDDSFHVPGPPLRRCDLSSMRAQAHGKLSRRVYSPECTDWVQRLDPLQWETVLQTFRVVPWVVYAALWLVADGLARRAAEAEPEDDGGLNTTLAHGVGAGGAAQAGRAVMDWLMPHR